MLVIEETGTTEAENALLKAKGYWDQLENKLPCFSGDTGAYLNGVYSPKNNPESRHEESPMLAATIPQRATK
jgi:hypothetical protein